jgi:nitroimidazol reductase NimA-like FMN-containing flavoprotein (pyridoxamine 5'-phosphate oxidase superfamily)
VNFELPVEKYLLETKIPLRLSTITASGWPFVLSLWYLYEDGALYCATPQSAKVVDYLMSEPRCGFEVAADNPPYCGVRGRAVASIEEDRGLEILERLLDRYLGGTGNPLAQGLLTRPGPEVAIRLEPQSSYIWNFTERMADSLAQQNAKICPG